MSLINPQATSTYASKSSSPVPSQQAQQPYLEEITTIFVVGFPDDITEREFQNIFIFCNGFEAATLKFPSDDEPAASSNASTASLGPRKQIIGFARFKTRNDAFIAKEVLCGKKIDYEKGCVLKAEIAKKNLHIKRASSFQQPIAGAGLSYLASPGFQTMGNPHFTNALYSISQSSSQLFESQSEDGSHLNNNSFVPFPIYPQYLLSSGAANSEYLDESNILYKTPSDHHALSKSFETTKPLPIQPRNATITSASAFLESSERFNESLTATCLHEIFHDRNAATISSDGYTHLLGTSLSNEGYTKIMQIEKSLQPPTLQPSAGNSSSSTLNQLLSSSNNGFESALFQNLENYSVINASNSLPSPLMGTQLKTSVKPVLSDQNNPPCNTLYVGNLPLNASEDELKDLFSRCLGYKRMCFKVKPNNGPMCFVEFESVKYATMAMNSLYGTLLSNSTKGGIRLSFSKNPLGVRSNPQQQQNWQ